MIGFNARTQFDQHQLKRKKEQANIRTLGHAGAAIRLTARRSIRRRKKRSPAGQPPHTRKGLLKRALRYQVEKQEEQVVVGTDAEVIGTSASAHEHGGRYKRQHYRRRPFMGPALEAIRPRLPRLWRDSVK